MSLDYFVFWDEIYPWSFFVGMHSQLGLWK